jgi:hypothetical protein
MVQQIAEPDPAGRFGDGPQIIRSRKPCTVRAGHLEPVEAVDLGQAHTRGNRG